jgi:hypothetical protein
MNADDADEIHLSPPGEEKPRFLLLPDGCKDLTEVYTAQEVLGPLLPASQGGLALPQKAVIVPDPPTVDTLAMVLHVAPYDVVMALLRMKIFAKADSVLSFETASAICTEFGFMALRAA